LKVYFLQEKEDLHPKRGENRGFLKKRGKRGKRGGMGS
jgi:hypothetical protein